MGYSITHIYWVLQGIHKSFPLKLGFGSPDMYLGAKLCRMKLQERAWAWAMLSIKYVQETVKKFTVHLAANHGGRFRLRKKAEIPFKMGYDSEFNTSLELGPDAVFY